MFDYKKHAEILSEVEGIVIYSLMTCKGLRYANCQMDDEQYIKLTTGVIGLMVEVLDKANELLSEQEVDFRLSHGLTYGDNGKIVEKEGNKC